MNVAKCAIARVPGVGNCPAAVESLQPKCRFRNELPHIDRGATLELDLVIMAARINSAFQQAR